jgi:hypothetical protein
VNTPAQRQPERQRREAVQRHRPGAVEHCVSQFGHRRVAGGVDDDRVLEEVAEQHRRIVR